MIIDGIDVIPFGIPIKKFADAYTGFSVSNAVLVKIYTNDGCVKVPDKPGFGVDLDEDILNECKYV